MCEWRAPEKNHRRKLVFLLWFSYIVINCLSNFSLEIIFYTMRCTIYLVFAKLRYLRYLTLQCSRLCHELIEKYIIEM